MHPFRVFVFGIIGYILYLTLPGLMPNPLLHYPLLVILTVILSHIDLILKKVAKNLDDFFVDCNCDGCG